MKLKFPHLLKPLGTIIQQNHGFFYPSGPFSYDHFNVIHPVAICLQELRIISFLVLNMSKLDLGRFFTINNCNFSVMFTTENQGLSVVLEVRYIDYKADI